MNAVAKLEEAESRSFDPRIEIRVWMVRNGIRPTDLARELGMGRSAITHWINGALVSKRIRDHFLSRGCPASLIDALSNQPGGES